MIRFTWIGGPSFVLDIGGFRVLGDPVQHDVFEVGGGRVIRLDTRAEVDVSGADVVCLSCDRADHYDRDVVEGAGAGRVLVPDGMSGESISWFSSTHIEKGDERLDIIAVPAATKREDEAGNGYFFSYLGGAKSYAAYWTGDAHFTEHTRRIQRDLGYANLLAIHLGAENGAATSPDAKEAMQIVYRMQPNVVVPIHHSTFSHYNESVSAFVERAGVTIYEKRVHVLREGEFVEKKIPAGKSG